MEPSQFLLALHRRRRYHPQLLSTPTVNTLNLYLQPYYQPSPAVPSPFTASRSSDPTYPTGLKSAWAFYVQKSKDILVGGAGFYSFFSAYSQACITPLTCELSQTCRVLSLTALLQAKLR